MFYEWAIKYVTIKEKEWLSFDGKAIRSTVTNYKNPLQNFVSLVTIFSSKQKQVLIAGKIDNGKESEIPKVHELIEKLDLKGVIFTGDALHCTKTTIQKIKKRK